MKNFTEVLIVLLFFVVLNGNVQVYLNPDESFENRLNELISRMTIEEKISQLTNEAASIPRLGISDYNWWSECLHGVARAGIATVFPQPIGLGATFDRNLLYRIGDVVSTEARAKHHYFKNKGQSGIYRGLTFWSPNINIFRDPRWGRGQETFGEDPYLMGELGVSYIRGLQGNHSKYLKVGACAKHFAVHSGPEALRHEFDVDVSNVDLHETYLPAFRKAVVEGNVEIVMGAYNRFRGESCSSHNFLLNDILRDTWGFNGHVVSDCGAIRDIHEFHKIKETPEEAAAHGVKNGCDLNCGKTYPKLTNAVEQGIISEEEIDVALKHLYMTRFRLGMFDPDSIVSFSKFPTSVIACDEHIALAREAAQKSTVLLKNEKNFLPLGKKKIKKIAVIGPNADHIDALYGNYHGTTKNPVTLLKGLKNKLSPNISVEYALGCHTFENIHIMKPVPSINLETNDGVQGLKGEYFNNHELLGEPVMVKIDDQIDFNWDNSTPSPKLKDDEFSVRWTGYLIPSEDGEHHIGCGAKSEIKVFIDDELLVTSRTRHNMFYREKTVRFEKGRKYKIKVEYIDMWGDAQAKLIWSKPGDALLEDAVKLANSSDVVILDIGLTKRTEGEQLRIEVEGYHRGERTHLDLPRLQKNLLKTIVETGKPVVLVLQAGSAFSINYAAEKCKAVIFAGYPGEQGGNAIADVIFGDYNPAGRLPITFYKSANQLPDFENYDMKGRTYRYFTEEPLFPFGYGLSYTSFEYSELHLPKSIKTTDSLNISVEVKNTGKRAGDEVVQLYLKDVKAPTPRPIHQLENFARIHLKPGESQVVKFTLQPRQLSIINNKGNRVIEPGIFQVFVGGEQPEMKGRLDVPNTQVLSASFKVKGKEIQLSH